MTNGYFPPPTNNIPKVGARHAVPPGEDLPLTRKQIAKAVEEALKNELKRIAVDANMYQLYGFKSAHSVHCYEKKRAIRAFLHELCAPEVGVLLPIISLPSDPSSSSTLPFREGLGIGEEQGEVLPKRKD